MFSYQLICCHPQTRLVVSADLNRVAFTWWTSYELNKTTVTLSYIPNKTLQNMYPEDTLRKAMYALSYILKIFRVNNPCKITFGFHLIGREERPWSGGPRWLVYWCNLFNSVLPYYKTHVSKAHIATNFLFEWSFTQITLVS